MAKYLEYLANVSAPEKGIADTFGFGDRIIIIIIFKVKIVK